MSSPEDGNIRVWDTRTDQLCGKPIATSNVHEIALSPALNGRSLVDQLIALFNIGTTNVFDVHTGHLYAHSGNSGWPEAFIRDGTKLMSRYPIRIYDIADLSAKHRNTPHEYVSVPRDGWTVGQDNELLFAQGCSMSVSSRNDLGAGNEGGLVTNSLRTRCSSWERMY